MEQEASPSPAPAAPPVLEPEERDWSRLPADLLARLLATLEVPELAASSAVCRGWRAARRADDPRLDLSLSALFRGGPCLAYSSAAAGPDVAVLRNLSLSSVSSSPAHGVVTLPAPPPFRARGVAGASRGWLATVGDMAELLLVNPATRAQLALPPTRTLRRVARRLARAKKLLPHCPAVFRLDPLTGRFVPRPPPEPLDPGDARFLLYRKVAMSSGDPSAGGDCTVLFIHGPTHNMTHDNQLFFFRVGGGAAAASKWSPIDQPERGSDYHDVFYDDGDRVFYAVRGTGEVDAVDLHGPTPAVNAVFKKAAENYKFSRKYIARAPWGDLLQVWIRKRSNTMVVYRVDRAEQKLAEAKDLRGHAMFIGLNTAFFLPVRPEHPVLQRNCVYRTEDNVEAIVRQNKLAPPRVAAYSLEDGGFTADVPLPGLDSALSWPAPVWITPSYSPV
ncbi:hypothetical protein ACP4OV_020949 [Aristida adscensionis]